MLDSMKSAHTSQHRDFFVTQNGWFTILRPARKFSAARVSGTPRSVIGQPDGSSLPANTPALVLLGSHQDQLIHRLMRASAIVAVAGSVTLALLLWICRP